MLAVHPGCREEASLREASVAVENRGVEEEAEASSARRNALSE